MARGRQGNAWDHNTFLRVVRVRPSSRACFCMLLVLLAARAGGEGQGESDDQARWAREHFVQHAWIFNVHSLHNYTKQCCLFSGQLLTHLGGAVIAKRLSRGWVEPHFIHQQRNSSLAESQIDAGTATLEQDSHILGQILVECSRVFRCNRSVFAPYNDKYLSLEQLHTHSDGVIDHLLVQSAEVISRQACIDARNCSSRSCPMVAVDAGGPRHMEFYGRRFFVKRVSCFPGDTGFFHSHVMPGAVHWEDKVIAIASNAIYNRQSTRELEPVMALLQPSPAVARLMAAFDRRLADHEPQFVAAHWRRGDRGLPEMGYFGREHWQTSHPANFACLLDQLVSESGVRTVLVMTNAGRWADRAAETYETCATGARIRKALVWRRGHIS
eukprot:Tamp_09624.p1 GENE.Tamp_09624~~Tamp_09624.p1  ORF type:complete len:385 (+),score=53.10 Tamp_09624:105-1259(+)